MGIKKIGDRVRIFVAIKQLRTKAVGHHKKRTRDSFAALDNRSQSTPYTPSSTSSPRHNTARERTLPTPSTATTASNRYSRQWDPVAFENFRAKESKGRPSPPLVEPEGRSVRVPNYAGMSFFHVDILSKHNVHESKGAVVRQSQSFTVC